MVGTLVSGIEERGEKRGRGDGKCSTGMKLISFMSHTSSNIRIIIYLINAVYNAQVGRCAFCVLLMLACR